MLQLADIWLLVAGLGMFLFGMHQLEYALKELGGASFRKMLRSFTKTTWKGILVGIVMTAILQSSSLVTLMVLAFLGAGMLRLKNALGVILGANVGTVVTAWLVVLLGFSVPIKDFAMPFIGLGSMAFLFASNRPNLKYMGMFLFGFGLLFLGLDFMKESIEEVATQFDLKRVAHLGLWVFLLTGIIVTAIIQSSSAMIVIILSSLNAQVIDLVQASVLVIGANIGTTITVGIGAIKGISDKRRLALAHFVFNVITGLIFFLFIEQVVEGVFSQWQVKDPLIKLVIITSLIKVTGVIIFYPFIGYLEKWLLKRFKRSDAEGTSRYVKKVSHEVPEIAIQAAEKETEGIFNLSLSYIEAVLGIDKRIESSLPYLSLLKSIPNTENRYEELKRLEDELTTYSLKIQEQNLTEIEASHLDRIMQAIRSQTFAAKEIRDIQHNIKQIQQSNDSLAKNILAELTEEMNQLIQDIRDGLTAKHLEGIAFYARKEKFVQAYSTYITKLHDGLKNKAFKDLSLSSVSNVIRKMLAAMQYIAESADVLVLAKQDIFPEINSDDNIEEKNAKQF
jgi:phosphate:Na+ symporter